MPKSKKVPIKIKNSSDFMRYLQTSPNKVIGKRTTISRRKRIVSNNIKLWKRIASFVDANYSSINWSIYLNPVTGKKINFTRRIVNSMISAEQQELENLNTDLAQQLLDEENFAATKIVVGKGEYAGDGNCHIISVNVGLGDSTLITSPKGVRILIDLGSDSLMDAVIGQIYNPSTGKVEPYTNPNTQNYYKEDAENNIINTIKSNLFLNGTNQIEFLILTHPDKDHYNKLGLLNRIQVGRAYYSGGNFNAYYPDNRTVLTACRNTPTNIKNVSLNQKKDGTIVKKIDNSTLPNSPQSNKMFDNEYIDPTTGAIVIYQEPDTGFKLSILAGNVDSVIVNNTLFSDDAQIKMAPQDNNLKLNATADNKKSLVTMVEYKNKRALFMADATAVTENFIVNQYGNKNILKNLLLCRIGHHGSLTSSSYRFVSSLTGLENTVASTSGKFTALHGLPKGEILGLYTEPKNSQAHSIYAYSATGNHYTKDLFFKSIKEDLFATGSNGTKKFTISGGT